MCPGANQETASDRLFYFRMKAYECMGIGHKGEKRDSFSRPLGRPNFSGDSSGQYTHQVYPAAERHLRQTVAVASAVSAFGVAAYALAEATGIV